MNLANICKGLIVNMQCIITKNTIKFGYVFRNRFNSEGIYDEKHLYNCIKYIFNNPVKAGICKKPEEYPFSNYNPKIYNLVFDDEKENNSFIDTDEDKKEMFDLVIKKKLQENNLSLEDLKNDNVVLKSLIITLKNEYNFSLRKIAQKLNIGREKIRSIYNK